MARSVLQPGVRHAGEAPGRPKPAPNRGTTSVWSRARCGGGRIAAWRQDV